jgi:hypothetical protein
MRQKKLRSHVAVDVARKRNLLLKPVLLSITVNVNGYRRQIVEKNCLWGYKQTNEENQLFKI